MRVSDERSTKSTFRLLSEITKIDQNPITSWWNFWHFLRQDSTSQCTRIVPNVFFHPRRFIPSRFALRSHHFHVSSFKKQLLGNKLVKMWVSIFYTIRSAILDNHSKPGLPNFIIGCYRASWKMWHPASTKSQFPSQNALTLIGPLCLILRVRIYHITFWDDHACKSIMRLYSYT